MAVPATYKPTHEPRTLVLCFDGTGNAFADENTNVIRFFSALEKRKRDRQLCYYQPGIGTYVSPTIIWASLFRKIAKAADQAFAWYLGGHIMSGYRFLMENYKEGDRICLFGFSRGAYTARCLAGMLHKVGLLPRCNEEQIQFAWEQYKDATDEGRKRAEAFKRTFSTVVDIEFMGVWDTVSSVGIFGQHMSFTSSNRIVKTFRHALALDEHRAKFKPNPWHRPAPNAVAAQMDPECGTAIHVEEPSSPDGVLDHITDALIAKRHNSMFSVDSDAYDREVYGRIEETDIKEVWFAGCHADVGGGSVENNTTNSLANPSLAWMVNEVINAGAGVLFRKDAFLDIPGVAAIVSPKLTFMERHPTAPPGLIQTELNEIQQPSYADALTSSPLGTPTRSPSLAYDGQGNPQFRNRKDKPNPTRLEIPAKSNNVLAVRQESMLKDALAPMYDQLVFKPFWWILEFIPVWDYNQDERGHWHRGFAWNRGRPREIQSPNPLFHASVKLRMLRSDSPYQPRAKWFGEPRYVE